MPELSWPVTAAVVAALWFVLLFVQLADLAAENWDLRSVGDRPLASRTLRDRSRELLWSLAGGSLIVVLAGFGIDVAVRLIFDLALPLAGIALLVLLLFAVGGFGVGAIAALNKPETGTYRTLRQELGELKGVRIDKAAIAHLHEELEATDARQAPTARAVAVVLRLVPVFIALLLLAVAIVVVVTGGPWWVILVAVLPVAASAVLAGAIERVSRTASSAWQAVFAAQRAEVVAELELLERRVNRGVPGLGERVSRALQILREQQS